jgi:anti-sigma B factor antagonist
MPDDSGDSIEAVITIDGEFDISSTEWFEARVGAELRKQPGSLVVDAPGLTFLDSSGLRSLLRARAAANHAGVAFRVADPSPVLRRLVERTGLQAQLLHD